MKQKKRATKKNRTEPVLFKLPILIKYNAEESYALSTLPDFRQLVHTCILLAAPLTLHLTLLTLEFQIALLLL